MRFRCNLCSRPPKFLEWEDSPVCPQCKVSGAPSVAVLIDVHLVVMDTKGPIEGAAGMQRVACMPDRPYLCRHAMEPFSASDDPRAVTCPRCRSLPAWKERAKLFAELQEMLSPSGRKVVVDLGRG